MNDPAVDAAVAHARRLGVIGAGDVQPRLLHAGANAVVHLHPEPVVARIAHWTASVRADAGAHLALEVLLARRASSRGADVVIPLPGSAGGPHAGPEAVMTFWPLLTGLRSCRDGAAAGRALARLHGGMSGYTGWMPGPEQVAADSHRAVMLLARLGVMPIAEAVDIGDESREALADMQAVTTRVERASPGRLVPLHGDPHGGNLLDVDGRATWWDLDDAWRGPVEWDLVVIRDSESLDGDEAVATYLEVTGFVPDPEALAVARRLRDVQSRAWVALYAHGAALDPPPST